MSYPDLRPEPGDYHEFYSAYIDLVRDKNLIEALEYSNVHVHKIIYKLDKHGDFRYDDGKWTVREVLMHMMDAERVFAYRALRFARNDQTTLSSFSENDYTPESNAGSLTMAQLSSFMSNLRRTTTDLFSSFSEEMLQRKGPVDGTPVSVVALGYIIAGHTMHHGNVLEERYLSVLG